MMACHPSTHISLKEGKMCCKRRAGVSAYLLALLAVLSSPVAAQETTKPPIENDSRTVEQLQEQLAATQQRLTVSEQKLRDLSAVVENLQQQMASIKKEPAPAVSDAQPSSPEPGPKPANITDDEWQLLNAKVEEHQQTKVESGSRFRLKLSGMFLFNVFGNAGFVDEIDLPRVAYPRPPAASDGTFGASIRQSVISLTGYGPTVAGARTSADLQVDFLGGIAAGYSGYSTGIARLRLARMRLDWDNTSVVGGLDNLFLSPNSPTSYMSVAEPAFASAGNLWTWTPTVRVEQRVKTNNVLWKFEGGVLDYAGYTGFYQDTRYATPGESSKQPAYAIRISGNGRGEDNPISFGVAGLVAPQRYPNANNVNGWGGLLDWKTPLAPHLELSGEFYRGKGIAGFGGVGLVNVQNQTYQYLVTTAPSIAKLSTLGGWSQLKAKVNARNEFNIAAGYGGFDSAALRNSAAADTNLLFVPARNESMLINYVFKPRSDLVFSLEYRRLKTYNVSDAPYTADHVGAAAAFLF
jgi:hypothetical protein